MSLHKPTDKKLNMKRILVIDDDELYRQMIAGILEQAGYSAEVADDGVQGLELAQADCPDLIICDVMMDPLDGYGVFERFRMDPVTGTIPFIFITGVPQKDSLRKGMSLGADDFLLKPFTATDLLSSVETRLRKHQEMTEKALRRHSHQRASGESALPHQLRTSLSTVIELSEIITRVDRVLSAMEVVEFGKSINRAGRSLKGVIENLLMLLGIEASAHDLKNVEVIRELGFSNSSELITAFSRSKGEAYNRVQDLKLALCDASLAVSPEHFIKILDEILDNAFKFSNVGTPVEVKTQLDKNELVLSVRDQGQGLSRKQVPNVGAYKQFEYKFYEHKGIGLGLTVAKSLTELHGGRMEIEVATGHGTTVLVFLPQRSTKPSS